MFAIPLVPALRRVLDGMRGRSERAPTSPAASRAIPASVRTISLRAGEVAAIGGGPRVVTIRRPHGVTIRATRGTVWLTTTPASGDAILLAGDELHVTDGFPVVAQALGGDAALEIARQ